MIIDADVYVSCVSVMPCGSYRVMCARYPPGAPEVRASPILVSGWAGRVNSMALHPKITTSKPWNTRLSLAVYQPANFPTQEATGPTQWLEIATNVPKTQILGIWVCPGTSWIGRTT